MVGVGLLAASLNISLLVTVVIADRAVELIVRGFAISRLKAKRRAPVVHDSDVWLLNIPCSILKYRHHPGMFDTWFKLFYPVWRQITQNYFFFVQ